MAALGSAAAVVFIGTGSLFTMDVFDELWWALAAYVFIRLVRREEPRLWLVFGLIAGIGLFTKLSMLFFGFALVVGILLTPQRAMFRTRWPWLGGAIAFAFLLPYIGWQIQNGWPTPEFWRNYGGIENGSPLDFLVSQILTMNPLTLPLTIAGLIYYFRAPDGKPYRALGWAFVILYVLFTITRAKSYFLSPAYPMMYAGGAVLLARVFEQRHGWRWARIVYPAALALSAIFFFPAITPTLAPEPYSKVYGFVAGSSGAKQQESATQLQPQILADRYGWPEMTAAVADVYNKLPADERAQACIYTLNYGEAGAINFFGPKYGLPQAISGHNTYWLWGPGNCSWADCHHHRLLAGGPGARVWLGDACGEVYLYLLHAGGERPDHLRLPPAEGAARRSVETRQALQLSADVGMRLRGEAVFATGQVPALLT